MKKGIWVCFLFALTVAFPGVAQTEARLHIEYYGFADHLIVNNGRLDHSFAQNSPLARAATLQLSVEQQRLFADWIERCGIFSLTAPDVAVTDPNHPGAEEHDWLQVEYGDKKIELSWTGVSGWNDPNQKGLLETALDELTKLSISLIREANLL